MKDGKKALYFYIKTDKMRGMCWSKSKEELDGHLERCKDMMNNLDYMEGIKLLKKVEKELIGNSLILDKYITEGLDVTITKEN